MSQVRWELVGVDDVLWQFNQPGCPLRLVSDPTGVAGAPFKNVRLQNVSQAGSTWVGRNDEIMPVTLEVHSKGSGLKGDAAVALWSDWRATLGRGDETLILRGISPGGGTREQVIRLESCNGDANFDQMYVSGYFREKATLASDESWFRKSELHLTFAAAGFGAASINNVADIEAPARYKVTGPITAPVIGTVDESVTLTGTTISAGQSVEINTDPENPYIKDVASGINLWPDVWENKGSPVYWRKMIPKGTKAFAFGGSGTTGATQIEVFLPQLYREGAA